MIMQNHPNIFRRNKISLNGTASLKSGGNILTLADGKEERHAGNAAGFSGTTVQQTGIGKGLLFQREIFTAEDNSFSAVRFRIRIHLLPHTLHGGLLFTGELPCPLFPDTGASNAGL